MNSDGVISKKEMSRLVKDMYGLLKKEDPNVSAAELIAKSAFAEMDENEDGKISLKEFSTACLAEKDFSRLLTSTALDIFMEEEKGGVWGCSVLLNGEKFVGNESKNKKEALAFPNS